MRASTSPPRWWFSGRVLRRAALEVPGACAALKSERLVNADGHIVGVGDDHCAVEMHALESMPAHGVNERRAQAAPAPCGVRGDELESAERRCAVAIVEQAAIGHQQLTLRRGGEDAEPLAEPGLVHRAIARDLALAKDAVALRLVRPFIASDFEIDRQCRLG